MCPSFRATGNEKDSTRGRANALRLAMSGQMQFKDLTDEAVSRTLDLCLSCKACKTECPSNVDMSKLKSEVLQLKYKQKGVPLSALVVRYAPTLSRWLSGWKAPLINALLKTNWVKAINKAIFRVDNRRTLPAYARHALTPISNQHKEASGKPKVVLFADTYVQCHDTDLGLHAQKLLVDCGFDVILANVGCCQRPLISNGFLEQAKTALTSLASKLLPFAEAGYPFLPSNPLVIQLWLTICPICWMTKW